MVEIHGKPFLEYQLELIRRCGINDVVLCIGHMGDHIKMLCGNGTKYGVNIKYSFEDRPLGTAGALKNAESLLGDIFFTMYGDSFLFLDFAHIAFRFISQDKLALMTVFKNSDRYGTSNAAVEANLVRKYNKREKSEDMAYIDYGVSIFRKEALKFIPEKQFYPLEELFSRLVDMKELMAYEVPERFYEIGSTEGLSEFEEYVGKAVK
jgi:NDP-sugar pyrophosphorylase family protein